MSGDLSRMLIFNARKGLWVVGDQLRAVFFGLVLILAEWPNFLRGFG
jgi:hypothetical protein